MPKHHDRRRNAVQGAKEPRPEGGSANSPFLHHMGKHGPCNMAVTLFGDVNIVGENICCQSIKSAADINEVSVAC